MCFIAIAASVVLPDANQCDEDSSRDDSKSLNIRGILKVVRTRIITCFKCQFKCFKVHNYLCITF